MHGFELCRLVKERYAATLVLQTSATFTAAEDRTAGLEYGADAYLVEPMEETELLATVRALLRISQAEKDRADTQLNSRNLPALLPTCSGCTTRSMANSSL